MIGELRKGVERIRRRDVAAAAALEAWLDQIVARYSERVLPVTAEIADVWGRLNARDALPVIDTLLAATAQVHGMTVVTRNVADIARTGVAVVDPFADDL